MSEAPTANDRVIVVIKFGVGFVALTANAAMGPGSASAFRRRWGGIGKAVFLPAAAVSALLYPSLPALGQAIVSTVGAAAAASPAAIAGLGLARDITDRTGTRGVRHADLIGA